MIGIVADHGRLGANDSQKGAHFVQVSWISSLKTLQV